ncbi:alpha/beta hydrolase [Agrococcus sp. BE272]|uniref:alpha/beta fold hydrolase n=1 Tax=Agrococcus sp. BE272 TaxID=2817727 RepID=UPI002865EB8A|nr:alpha/beta hydrolase [Agrococcus sp. BE272]MDR7233574.1 pimeloyl-ACP methyl ester carboxylesterase/uncharacterized protein YciI [Agrococcus sp. BE272]
MPEFVDAGAASVRLWRAGSGAATIVLSDLTTATSSAVGRLAALEPDREFIGIELPGFGESELPAGDALSVDRLVQLIVETRRKIGAVAAPLVAFGHAAPIAEALIEAAAVDAGLVGVFVGPGRTQRVSAPPDLTVRADGTHLVRLWSFLRDSALLGAGARVDAHGAPLESVEAIEAAFLSAARDPGRYLELWRALASGANPAAPRRGEGEQAAARWVASIDAAPLPVVPSAPPARRRYVMTPSGIFHCRITGEGRAVLILPSAPGSAEPVAVVAERLARSRTAIAVDYLGNGDSSKPEGPIDVPWIARSLLQLADALHLDSFDVWGTHTGANVALEMSLIAPERIGRLVLEAPILMDTAEVRELVQRYFHDISATDFGDHVLRAWQLRRDMFLFWPWYERSRAAARAIGVPPVEMLHDWTIGLLKSGATYPLTYRAAFEYPTADRLRLLEHPALICAGPADMLAGALAVAPRLAPEATVMPTAATVWYPRQSADAIESTLSAYEAFLAPARPQLPFGPLLEDRLRDSARSEEVRDKSRHLPELLIAVESEGARACFALSRAGARAAPIGDADITITGPAEAWFAVLSGEHALVRETNVHLGRLAVRADPVVSSWAMPAIAALLKPRGEAA